MIYHYDIVLQTESGEFVGDFPGWSNVPLLGEGQQRVDYPLVNGATSGLVLSIKRLEGDSIE